MNKILAVIIVALLAGPALWSAPALGQFTDESTSSSMTYEDSAPDTAPPCTPGPDVVCAERQLACTYGWRGLSWCMEKPLWFESDGLSNDEIYPRVWVYYSENAIRNNRYVRFRLCEDVGGAPDPCMNYWWAAKGVKIGDANKWWLVTPPRSTDDCRYTDATTHYGYYSQGQGKDGTNKTDWKNEGDNVPNGSDHTQLDCIRH